MLTTQVGKQGGCRMVRRTTVDRLTQWTPRGPQPQAEQRRDCRRSWSCRLTYSTHLRARTRVQLAVRFLLSLLSPQLQYSSRCAFAMAFAARATTLGASQNEHAARRR